MWTYLKEPTLPEYNTGLSDQANIEALRNQLIEILRTMTFTINRLIELESSRERNA